MAARSALLRPLLGALALTVGCAETERAFVGLDGPGDVAILPAGEFFEVPVAFVSNFRSGRVSKLDLKRTMVLVEDGPAPWLPGPDLAFGADRALTEIALAVRPGAVDVWVSDDLHDQLLRAPYLRHEDDAPVWSRAVLAAGPTTFDAGGAALPAGPRLHGLRVRPGRATSEDWTLTWTGRDFSVRGTAAGPQRQRVVPGAHYETDGGELAFVLSLDDVAPAVGTTVLLTVDSGVQSADAGGLVMDLAASIDGAWIFAAVLPDDGDGFVSIWDALDFVELDRVALPVGAVPERLALGATDGVLWVADSSEVVGEGRIHRLDFVPGDRDSVSLRSLPVPEPNIDVAEGADPAAARIFVAAAFTDAVWMLDGLGDSVLDVNLYTPELDPMRLRGGAIGTGSPISGLAATPGPARTWLQDERGERLSRYGVVATTFAGELYWIDAETGCLIHDLPANAFLDVTSGSEASTFRDVGQPSNPELVVDPISDTAITTNACGGITINEVWTLRYSEVLQAYEVQGSRSGEQAGLCFEGERYVTDAGQLSLLIMPGTVATTEGDAFALPVNDGLTPIGVQQLPGDPVVFTEQFDDRSGAWWKLRERQVVVVPHLANDIVLWVDLEGQGRGLRIYQ